MSHRIFTPCESSTSSLSPGSSSTRSREYENPEHPPPRTPTRRLVFSAGMPCSVMIFLICAAAVSLKLIGINRLLLRCALRQLGFVDCRVLLALARLLVVHCKADALQRHVDPPARHHQVGDAHVLHEPHDAVLQRLRRAVKGEALPVDRFPVAVCVLEDAAQFKQR